ncbi:MAG TPA: bifunctional UDP-sugar hydrolase/5'-nucleotidase, partial [Candidatus Sulfobium mesophilum]|nr:bifunctional UDP-sugar hydrolase/5'-nucleotidase [Candidatus Sulfobium mesophilum]
MKRLMPVLFSSVLCVFFLGAAWAEQHVIRILHMNDFHGFAEPYEPSGSNRLIGGIAFLAAKVGRLRSEKNSLLLAAGDMIRGNNWSDTSRGRSVIELMNAMKFDAMVLGNHEFDFGQEELKKRIAEAKFPVLGANVEGMGQLKQYVLKVMGGTRVAIIGVVTEYTPESTHSRNVAGLKFSPPADTLRGYMRELKDRVDIIVVLSHCGYSEDRLLADQVRGIDVIVGGHSHTKLEKPVRVNGTIIVQAWEHGKALGVLDLTVRDGRIVEYAGHLEEIMPVADLEDKTVENIVEQYRDKGDKAANEVIGTATVDFEAENVRRQGTNLGDLIADIMRQVSGAD